MCLTGNRIFWYSSGLSVDEHALLSADDALNGFQNIARSCSSMLIRIPFVNGVKLRAFLWQTTSCVWRACRRVLAPWRFSSGLDSDDGDHTALWWRWCSQSAAGPADGPMIAPRRCSHHGHRGLHLRYAAWWRTLGVLPEGGRGGHLQTFLSLPGRLYNLFDDPSFWHWVSNLI